MIAYGQVKGRKYKAVQPVYEPPADNERKRSTMPGAMPELDRTMLHPLKVDGVEYPSLSAGCKAMGTSVLSFRKLTRDARAGTWKNGSTVHRYERLEPIPREGHHSAFAVQVGDTVYASRNAAKKALGLGTRTMDEALECGRIMRGKHAGTPVKAL